MRNRPLHASCVHLETSALSVELRCACRAQLALAALLWVRMLRATAKRAIQAPLATSLHRRATRVHLAHFRMQAGSRCACHVRLAPLPVNRAKRRAAPAARERSVTAQELGYRLQLNQGTELCRTEEAHHGRKQKGPDQEGQQIQDITRHRKQQRYAAASANSPIQSLRRHSCPISKRRLMSFSNILRIFAHRTR